MEVENQENVFKEEPGFDIFEEASLRCKLSENWRIAMFFFLTRSHSFQIVHLLLRQRRDR